MRDLTDAELDVVAGGKRKWAKLYFSDFNTNVNLTEQSNTSGDIYATKGAKVYVIQTNSNETTQKIYD